MKVEVAFLAPSPGIAEVEKSYSSLLLLSLGVLQRSNVNL